MRVRITLFNKNRDVLHEHQFATHSALRQTIAEACNTAGSCVTQCKKEKTLGDIHNVTIEVEFEPST